MFLSLFSAFLIIILLSLFLSFLDCHLLSCALIRAVSDPITISMHQQLLVLHFHNWLLYNTSQYFIWWDFGGVLVMDFGGMTIQDPKIGGIAPNCEWSNYWRHQQLLFLHSHNWLLRSFVLHLKYTCLNTKHTFLNIKNNIKYSDPNTKYTFLNTNPNTKTHFPV